MIGCDTYEEREMNDSKSLISCEKKTFVFLVEAQMRSFHAASNSLLYILTVLSQIDSHLESSLHALAVKSKQLQASLFEKRYIKLKQGEKSFPDKSQVSSNCALKASVFCLCGLRQGGKCSDLLERGEGEV